MIFLNITHKQRGSPRGRLAASLHPVCYLCF